MPFVRMGFQIKSFHIFITIFCALTEFSTYKCGALLGFLICLICYLKIQRRQALFARDDKINYSIITRKLDMFFYYSLKLSQH